MSTARHLRDFELRPDVLAICALAIPIGAVASVVAWALLQLIGLFTNLFFAGRLDTTLVAPHNSHWWVVLFVPVLGGLIVGLMARYGSEKIRGHGMPEAIESILVGGSKVQPKVAVLKPVSAAISIGSGGPFGAEGPIIMTGGAVGSVIAQFLRLTADQRKTLLVAGAAAGMSATFNAPLASIMLAVELLLFEWRPRSMLPTALAVTTATICRWSLLGTAPIFGLPDTVLHLDPAIFLCCAAIGVLGALLAIVATGLVYLSEDLFGRLPLHWMWWPAIGGLVIGAGGLVEPRALGVGYDVIDELLHGNATLGLIFGILVVKTLIWSISLGSGTSGGVLAPTFMIGAALGALVGHLFPPVNPGFWALLGLAAVLGGVMRSPLTGVIFSLELTHLWNALLPIVVAASIAYLLSALVLGRSVLTEKVARRGYHLTREYSVDPLEVLFASEVMWTDMVTLPGDLSLRAALDDFTSPEHVQERDRQHRQRLYPILEDNRLAGVVTRRDMLEVTFGPDDDRLLSDVMVRSPLVVHADHTLREVANLFAEHGVARAPVVDRDDHGVLLGIITVTQLLQGRHRDLVEERTSERVLPLPWARRA
ncbi:chloride channel protein [Pseudonocardia spinosispora]|uniref:chloride channel protein n=1 Tax=Pseudonocardia spinosispora TaxID=103441 RepID=UPI00041A8024|nr:chloride channel protein [Pseudonocardia spinosispora]